jgi:hypothetical protein
VLILVLARSSGRELVGLRTRIPWARKWQSLHLERPLLPRSRFLVVHSLFPYQCLCLCRPRRCPVSASLFKCVVNVSASQASVSLDDLRQQGEGASTGIGHLTVLKLQDAKLQPDAKFSSIVLAMAGCDTEPDAAFWREVVLASCFGAACLLPISPRHHITLLVEPPLLSALLLQPGCVKHVLQHAGKCSGLSDTTQSSLWLSKPNSSHSISCRRAQRSIRQLTRVCT